MNSNKYEKILNISFNTSYQYIGITFNKIIGSAVDVGNAPLEIQEIQFFGKEITNISYTAEEYEFPPKSFNSFTPETQVIYLNQNPVFYETITLNTEGINYGSGIYEIYYSSKLDNNSRMKNFFNKNLNDDITGFFGTNRYLQTGYYNHPTFSNYIINDNTGTLEPTIIINNNGRGYNTLPTLQLIGGNPTTSAILRRDFSRTFEYTWNIPDIVINDLARLTISNCIGSGATSFHPFIIRIKDVLFDNHNTYMSDSGEPILSIARNKGIFSSFNSAGTRKYHLTLSPQVINKITIVVDEYAIRNVGINADINFILCLKIEEFDVKLTRIDNPYEEGIRKIKPY